MEYETFPAADFGHALRAISVNLLVRDVLAHVTFLTAVFGMQAHQATRDFAIVLHAGQPFQLHADHTYHANPLPDLAVSKLDQFPDAILLQAPTDKRGHGLREAIILCPMGYAWVPSCRI